MSTVAGVATGTVAVRGGLTVRVTEELVFESPFESVTEA
jgi:hypothetical protein